MAGFKFEFMMLVACTAFYYRFASDFAGGEEGTGLVIDGIPFASELQMGGVRQQVTGGGTRTKYGVAKVYAAALYLDSRGAASALKQHAGKTPTKKAFFDSVIKGQFAKTLFLQFHRTVESSAVASALSDSLSSRLSKTAVTRFSDALVAVLPGDVSKGTKIFFSCKGEALMMGVGTPVAKQTLKEKGACAALLDVYFGKDPISPALKSGMAAGFAKRFYK